MRGTKQSNEWGYDEAKYKALLEGLEVSVLKFSYVLQSSYSERYDSNYFQKEFLENSIKQNEISLDKICMIRSGTTPIDRDSNLKNGVILLKTDDIRNGVLNYTEGADFFYISEATNKKMTNTELKANDVLINIVGATTDVIGRCSVLSKNFPKANITQAMALLRVNKEYEGIFNPHFLFIYLISKYGHRQIRRLARPTGQFNMNLQEVGTIKIPCLFFNFQKVIASVILLSEKCILQSKTLYTQAEQILLEELGFNNFPKVLELSGSCSIKTFKESYETSSRLDAEYYQPKYDEILNAIRGFNNGFTNLKAIIKEYSTGFPFDSESYVKDGFSLIRINNIKKGELDLSNANQIPAADINLSIKDVVKENDLLLSMSGTIGNCCKIPPNTKAIINQRILRFSVQNFDTDVLCLYINSVFGALQLERVGTGGVQTNISSGDIFNVEVPLIAEATQTKISNLIQQSFQLRQQSKHLLEVAKQAVEIAIEQNETLAIDFINNKLENINHH